MQIAGRTVLITGASSGIGAAAARALARKGAHVLLLARTQSILEQLAAEIRVRGGTAHVFPVDLADLAAIAHVTQTIKREIGTPDILINNAGAGRWLFIEETNPTEAAEMMAVPYLAAFAITQAFLGEMLRRGRGHIVNLTSPAGYIAWPGAAAYSVARWAMRGFTAALRADLSGTGVGVTLIVPGKVASPYFANNPGSEERIPQLSKLYRTLTPEQVAEAIVTAIEHNRREVVLPFMLKLTMLLHRFFPRPIEWLVIRSGWKRAASSEIPID
ncbi:MAG: putative oxidoreductase YqjQ [Herpetosiphonaceae bacterium]|nr:MAG: putative oxidoreductase YqjQ [Herpetosiphonaceae bacterium]